MTDTRPASCRERLREEGKAYPKSSCTACGANLATGLKCKHVAVDIEARDKEGAPKIVIDLAGAMEKMTPQMIEAMAPILRDPMVMALEAQIMALQEALNKVRVAIGMEAGIAGAPGDIAAEVAKQLQAEHRRGWKACIATLMQGGSQTGSDIHDEEGTYIGRFHAFFPAGATHEVKARHYETMAGWERAAKDAAPLDFGDLRLKKAEGGAL